MPSQADLHTPFASPRPKLWATKVPAYPEVPKRKPWKRITARPEGPIAATASLECLESTMASMICIRVMAEVESIMGPASFSRRGTWLVTVVALPFRDRPPFHGRVGWRGV